MFLCIKFNFFGSAGELCQFADILEKAEDFDKALHDLVCKTFTEHQRIIFDGNGYSAQWQEEAAHRGLSNYPTTAECLPAYIQQKNIDLVTRHGIFTEAEFRARYAIHMEAYNKIVGIEARTMLDMAMRQILPASLGYVRDLTEGIAAKCSLGLKGNAERSLVERLSDACDTLYDSCQQLRGDLAAIPEDTETASRYYLKVILPDMNRIRTAADTLEELTEKSRWPFPTYADLLYY